MSNDTVFISKTLKVTIPQVPNFFIIECGKSFNESPKMSIADFSDKELSDIADAWKKRLIERAAEIRKSQ